jgi:hypothetical protein
MTTIAALIPRLRYRTGRIVAIRCATCKTWRKPRHFDPRTNVCHGCTYEAARRRIATRATRRG